MPVGRKYTAYRRIVEKELKLRQLDVYRTKNRDILRVYVPGKGVKLIELPRRRDEMTPDEFRSFLKEALSKL